MEQLFVFALIIIIVVIANVSHSIRARSMLDEWARERGYEIVDAKYAWFWWGPFTLTSGRDAVVYRITVRDQNGVVSPAWARCNGWLAQFFGNKVDVNWD